MLNRTGNAKRGRGSPVPFRRKGEANRTRFRRMRKWSWLYAPSMEGKAFQCGVRHAGTRCFSVLTKDVLGMTRLC